ncbi:PGF-pre-PGF domain-containing protein [Methanofollis aquaemaris]|uniref:PGF-pre-PGF domain-containing protein n=1 Tax=Methanofollis aquaemaris TaxID=126734 RepID=UPI00223EA24D|nr:PGF-pre-PGF domain-containing protein [Methanofollis aquaemaris]
MIIVEQTGRVVYTYDKVTLYHTTDDAIEGVLALFSVEGHDLRSQGIEPVDVVLYRYHHSAWHPLPAMVIREDETARHISATSPGFSFFAIGSDPSPPSRSGE